MFPLSKKNIIQRSGLLFDNTAWKWVNYLRMMLTIFLLLIFFHGLTFFTKYGFNPFNFWMQTGLFGIVWSILYWANPTDHIKTSEFWLNSFAITKTLKQDIHLSPTEARVSVTEGRYHMVRRMFAAVGNHVEALHRERLGGLALPDDLPAGEWRLLDQTGIDAIFAA